MERRQKLIDQYEDALFALLMDDVAVAEGKRLLEINEQLKSDPNAAVPAELDRKCLQTVKRETRRKSFYMVKQGSVRIFRMTAAVALVATMLFTTVFASSETFRAQILNAVIEIFDDYGRITFTSGEESVASSGSVTVEGRLDLSGVLASHYWEETPQTSSDSLFYELQGKNNEIVSISLTPVSEALTFQFDTENSERWQTTVRGIDATVYQKDTMFGEALSLVWVDTSSGYIVDIWGFSVTEEALVDIAENITF